MHFLHESAQQIHSMENELMNTNPFVEFFNSGFGTAIKAILILIVAFIAAAICKSLIVKLLSRTKLAEVNKGKDSASNPVELIGKLVQLVVFLVFVPGIFETLGMTQVSAPILTLLNTLWGYVPNIIGAVVILWVGFYVARLVRELLVPVLNKLEVNRLQKIAGIEVSDEGKLSNTLAYIVYILILIPVIITALYVLNIRAISDPAIAMLGVIFNYIPNILAALVIIAIGWVLARFIGGIVTRLLAASGLDAKLDEMTGNKNPTYTLSNVAGKTVEVILVIFFIVESLRTLRLGVLTRIGEAVIAYMPYLLTAFLILIIAMFLAGIADKAIRKAGHASAAVIVKYLIYAVAGFMILNQLGIARTLVDPAFIIVIAAVAVAFAISFGIGGREFARNTLAALQKKLNIESDAKAQAEAAASDPLKK